MHVPNGDSNCANTRYCRGLFCCLRGVILNSYAEIELDAIPNDYDRRGVIVPPTLEGWAYRLRRDPARETINHAISPRARAAHWQPVTREDPLPREELLSALEDAGVAQAAGWAVVFSHDHYLTVFGGTQNCMNDEEAALRHAGWTYLHFCPVQPLPMLSDPVPAHMMRLVASLNGVRLGVVTMADVATTVTLLGRTHRNLTFIIHQLLGHAPELIAALVTACPNAQTVFWAHDLFALCPSVHLLRNDISFCGSPPIGSPACGICPSGSERPGHVTRMGAFLANTCPTVLAPSATILKVWQRHTGFTGPTRVVPPCRVEFQSEAAPFNRGRPLRVGHLGAPLFAKGWQAFESLARWHQGDPRYEFIQLGTLTLDVPNIRHIYTQVSREDRHAMVKAVIEAGVDVAINWSLCYESFSFTAMEAVAGGAFVIARKGAGNVGSLVTAVAPNRACVIETEVELQALFAEGHILELAAGADRRTGHLVPSQGTGAILLQESGDA